MGYLICLLFPLAKSVSNFCFHIKQHEEKTKCIHIKPMQHNKATISFSILTDLQNNFTIVEI